MPVHSCLYTHNGSRWKQEACEQSIDRSHAEAQLIERVHRLRLPSQLLLLIQNAAPCPERCETLLKNQSKWTTKGKGNRAELVPGHSIIVKIIGQHAGYRGPAGHLQYYFKGEQYDTPPVGFPPIPAYPPDPNF